ncbi:TetR/AcrR family transcriptional regulator [Sphingobium amiense]|uniref:TetR/AcrR family transcriptional regulator n=1 Tax=Sphingobium amiense TaxID=135719 RepID=UPI000A027555|nr:TetR family transcriptional regulator [Sphingobium amiense]
MPAPLICDKASEQLLAGSYAKLNFARIAEDLDITRANVHYHFKNKENLAIEVFTRHKARTLSQYQQLRERFAGDFVGFFQRD